MQIDLSSAAFSDENIKKLEKFYNARYVCDAGLDKVDLPSAIFWQDNPPHDYSNYLCVYRTDPVLANDPFIWVRSGAFILDREIIGAVADNGDVIFSRFRHDFRESADGSVWIDGGHHYVRTAPGTKLVELRVIKDKLEIVENEDQGTD